MAETPKKTAGENHDPAVAATVEDDAADTPKKSSSVRSKVGNALKRAFTPRKTSATSDELGDVADREPSDDSDGKKKKKGIGAALRSLSSKVRTPRGTALQSEGLAATPTEVQKEEEEKSRDVMAVTEEVAETAKDKAKEVVEAVNNLAQDVSTAGGDFKEQVGQGLASAVEEAKVAVPDVADATPAAAVDVASSALAREVEAPVAKVAEQVEKAQVEKVQVATRAVELPTKPVVEKTVEQPESKSSPRKRRGPVISGICIAVGIAIIAFKLATNQRISEHQGVVNEPKARKPWESFLKRIRTR